jgi:hypothetical protein
MEKIRELYHGYWEQIMTWYNGLEQFYQYGVLFLIIVISCFIISGFVLSRNTK